MNEMSVQECRLENEKRWSDINLKVKEVVDANEVMLQRLNKQEKLIDDIQQLSTSVAILANNMKSLLEEQQRQNIRLEELERRPARRWDSIVDKILMVIVGALLGFILIKLGLPPA